jgi:arylsulfatase
LLPTRQGFDYFFGTPTSNDRVVNLLRNAEMVEQKADMSTLTKRYTDEAIQFIRENQQKPFFVYLAHTMPHTLLAASEQFRGKSAQGLYGDVIEEIDWNVGRILECIDDLELDQQTYIIFTSDNGPWWIKKEHGGSAQPLRGAKTSSWEGGVRVPCVMRAPGRIPPDKVCESIATTMDLLPTLASLAGAALPTDRRIDGHDLSKLIHGGSDSTAESRTFLYYVHTHLQAVRQGRWKLHLARPARPPWCPAWARHIAPEDVIEIRQPLLFDLHSDIGETTDVAAKNPDTFQQLLRLAEMARQEIGDFDRIGTGARFFDSQPRRPDIGAWRTAPEGNE